jgi:hypothetical protein
MSCKFRYILALALVGAACAPLAQATTENVGYVSFDLTTAPSTYEFDIIGQSGVNNSGSTAFPVVTTVDLTGLSLVLSFASGPNEVFGSTYFTPAGDGESFNGTAANFGSNEPTKAVLTGTFSTTSFLLFNGTTVTVNPTFTATISPGGALIDGDYALISATTKSSTGPSITPEPGTWLMVGSGMGLVLFCLYRRRNLAMPGALSFPSASAGGLTLALAVAVLAAPAAHATAPVPVKLNALTAPTSGLAGTTLANVTGSGFPAGPISPSAITLSFSKTCGGTALATTAPNTESALLGNTDRVQFLIPAVLKTGTYYVSMTGTSAGSVSFASSNCSALQVTNTTVTLASCVPTSSIAVTVGSNVDAYVPFGYWEGGSTGIEEVALEGTDPAQHFATSGAVNSCASNSVTKEVVCTENTANVDLISGSTLTTLSSSSNQDAGFTGGSCKNCGVAINSSTNTAVIGMGLSGGGGSGVQYLDLATNTFNTAFPLQHYVSEDISIDSGRNLILSPGEDGVYDLLQVGAGNALTEYGNYIGGTLDSAAEDCTTGIALSAYEFSDDIYITDLTQAKFTAGSPGTWTAPGQFINLGDYGYSAGSSGITSAPGTTHLAVVTGEFGGSSYSALLLPSTSGAGTPTLADYAYVSSMPATPDGAYFSAGYDPHTLTAYTSPNTGKSYAVFADYYPGYPDYLGVVDLACVLALPRNPGTHIVSGSAASCTRYVAIP